MAQHFRFISLTFVPKTYNFFTKLNHPKPGNSITIPIVFFHKRPGSSVRCISLCSARQCIVQCAVCYRSVQCYSTVFSVQCYSTVYNVQCYRSVQCYSTVFSVQRYSTACRVQWYSTVCSVQWYSTVLHCSEQYSPVQSIKVAAVEWWGRSADI